VREHMLTKPRKDVKLAKNHKEPGTYLGTEFSTGGTPRVCYSPITTDITMYAGDKGHYGYPDFPPNSNVGGTFLLKGARLFPGIVDMGELWYNGNGGALGQHYVGGMHTGVSEAPGCSQADGSSRAAEAYRKMKPTAPLFSGLSAIYELKDLPRMLQQRLSGNGLKDIGSYFLALKFGWENLFQDIKNLVHTQQRVQDRLNWLLRHNGQPVRRNIVLADSCDVTAESAGWTLSALNPQLVTQYFADTPRYHTVWQAGERWWASASFRYWLPTGPDDVVLSNRVKAALYGAYPSPKQIWNVIPWTWLIDWFSNAGDVISNLEAGVANRCAASHFYMMRYNYGRNTTTVTGQMWGKGQKKPISSTTVLENFTKSRVQGDPFGFNTAENTLSGMQLAILGALGLSRLR
jgi:hypothetical protein